MNEKIKVSPGAGVIAFALHTLGFMPAESLVIMGMAGKRLRATPRIDLPRSEAVNETIATVATTAMLNDVEADGSLFIIFTGETSIDGHPREALVEALMRELDEGNIPARNGWLVGPEGWVSYLDLDSHGTAGDNTALIAWLQDVMIRDRLMADTLDTSTSVEDFNNALLGNLPEAPNWRRVDDAEATLLLLLTQTPGTHRAPLLTSLGWIQWLKGKGTSASQYYTAALEADNGYRLAQLLDQLTTAGHIAPVAKTAATAYKPE